MAPARGNTPHDRPHHEGARPARLVRARDKRDDDRRERRGGPVHRKPVRCGRRREARRSADRERESHRDLREDRRARVRPARGRPVRRGRVPAPARPPHLRRGRVRGHGPRCDRPVGLGRPLHGARCDDRRLRGVRGVDVVAAAARRAGLRCGACRAERVAGVCSCAVETISALELVVGFPKLAQVFPAAAGTLRIESDGRAIGFSLEAGAQVAAREAVVTPALLHQPTAPFGVTNGNALGRDDEPWRQFTTWLDGTTARPLTLHLPASTLSIGDDDRVTAITPTAIHVLDRATRSLRSVAVPPPLDLRDPVKGGVGGELDRTPLYIEPGFVVFVRSPALLVATRENNTRALVFDRVRWAIETHLVAREPKRGAPARRGRFDPLTIVTDTGTLRVSVGPEPVRVRDRLWPPCGWATVALANGATAAAHPVPPEHRVEEASVVAGPQFLVVFFVF